MTSSKPRVLYLTYDGLLEPLGQSQVLAYLELNSDDFSFTVLSFEKHKDISNRSLYKELLLRTDNANIEWIRLRYHKSPTIFATSFDIIQGVLMGFYLQKSKDIKLLHARSYVAGLIALLLSKITGIPYIFDIRGFWVDERVDGGIWQRGHLVYRVARWLERKLYSGAAHITTLTENSINYFPNIMKNRISLNNISVIPTCTDVRRFSKKVYKNDQIVIGNLGSLGTWYALDPIFHFFTIALKQNSKASLVFINRDQHALIISKVREHHIDSRRVHYRSASQSEIPKVLMSIDVGLMLYKDGISRAACSPTRFAEYLSAGIPCLISGGVGDTQAIVEREGVGIIISDYRAETLERSFNAIQNLMTHPDLADRCRDVAQKYFSLEDGASKYASIYYNLIGKKSS